jgi:hypothetical protein
MMLSGTRSLATDAGLPDYAPVSIG